MDSAGSLRTAVRADAVDLHGLASRMPDVIYRYRVWPSLATDYVSEAVTRHTGYTPEEFYADPTLSFAIVHPDDRRLLEQRIELGPLSSEPILLRWLRKDGGTVWAEHRDRAVHDRSGRLIAIEGIAREIPDPTGGPEPAVRIVDGVRIDLSEHAVHVDGRTVRLSPIEYRLLVCLTDHPGRVQTRAQLMRCLWRTAHTGSGHPCETYISRLRRKIERDPHFPERIVTVRGRGYKYVARSRSASSGRLAPFE